MGLTPPRLLLRADALWDGQDAAAGLHRPGAILFEGERIVAALGRVRAVFHGGVAIDLGEPIGSMPVL